GVAGVQPRGALVVRDDKNPPYPRCVLFHRPEGIPQLVVVHITPLVVGLGIIAHGTGNRPLFSLPVGVVAVYPQVYQINFYVLVAHYADVISAQQCLDSTEKSTKL